MSSKKSFSNTNTGNKHPEPYLEANTENVSMTDKLKSMGHFFDRVPICMVSTISADSDDLVARCMGLAGKEIEGAVLYLFTNTESTKVTHVVNDPRVNVSFLRAEAGEWASVSGDASIVTDRALVAKYYKPSLRNWFGDLKDGIHDGSKDDPRIGLLKVIVTGASYAIVDEGHVGLDIESYDMKADGKLPRINRQGRLSRAEFDEHRRRSGIE